MLEHIENMRSKHEHIKKRYAFLISFSISTLIFVGWIASYGLHKTPIVLDKKDTDSETKVEAPASALTASVSGLFDDLKSMFSGSNKIEYSAPIEVKGGKR